MNELQKALSNLPWKTYFILAVITYVLFHLLAGIHVIIPFPPTGNPIKTGFKILIIAISGAAIFLQYIAPIGFIILGTQAFFKK